jgi:hypothetical protein
MTLASRGRRVAHSALTLTNAMLPYDLVGELAWRWQR